MRVREKVIYVLTDMGKAHYWAWDWFVPVDEQVDFGVDVPYFPTFQAAKRKVVQKRRQDCHLRVRKVCVIIVESDVGDQSPASGRTLNSAPRSRHAAALDGPRRRRNWK